MSEQSYLYTAKAKQKEGDFAGAITDYRLAIRTWEDEDKGPSYLIKEAYLYLGLAYRAEGRLAEALKSYQTMAELLTPSYQRLRYNFYYYQGCAYFAQGNIEAGKANHHQLFGLLLRPDIAKDFCPQFVHQRDLDSAVEDCSRASDYFCRGLAKKAKGDWVGAIADFKVACEESPENHELRQWWLTAQILQNGFPNPYSQQTLQPGIEYVSISYAEDKPPQIYITQYTVDTKKHREGYSRTEGIQLHEHYKNSDKWIFLRAQSHKEGRTYYYWKSREGIT